MNPPPVVWMESYGGLYVCGELVRELILLGDQDFDEYVRLAGDITGLLEDESYRPDQRPIPADVAALADE